MPAFLTPLLISAGIQAIDAATRKKGQETNIQFPAFDAGQARSNLIGRVGENVNRATRSAQKSLASRGQAGSGQGLAIGRGLFGQGQNAIQRGLTNIAGLQNRHNQARANFDLRQQQANNQIVNQRPGFGDYLAGTVAGYSALQPFFGGGKPSGFGGGGTASLPQIQPLQSPQSSNLFGLGGQSAFGLGAGSPFGFSQGSGLNAPPLTPRSGIVHRTNTVPFGGF
tara:strand:+ start:2528 stop:3202 length:675 start_codon:yes stop_codon:yes gene_type:complete